MNIESEKKENCINKYLMTRDQDAMFINLPNNGWMDIMLDYFV